LGSTTENADQTLLDAVALGQVACPGLLVHAAVVQVHDGPFLLDRFVLRRLPHLSRDSSGKGLEILEQHLTVPEKVHHAGDVGQEAPRAAETNPIKTMQNAQDVFAAPLYKGLHDVASSDRRARICRHPHSTTQKQRLLFVVAATPR
jgi:hypothetical protein